MSTERLYGYAGKILRIDLTTGKTWTIPTSQYVPKYIGGRGIAAKIFYDEIKDPNIKAFDPENLLIYMTGPTTGTGIPTGGRCTFCSIMPNSLPEMFGWSSIAGYVGSSLKFAGYDGIVMQGRAPEHSYLLIEDDKVQLLSADPIWGKSVHDTQDWIFEHHGMDCYSAVIGIAGENLMRNAAIITSADSAAAKGGMGAVMGSKNLKAIAVRGTGDVIVPDVDKVLEIRRTLNEPPMRPNPIQTEYKILPGKLTIEIPEGREKVLLACSRDCTMRCNRLLLHSKDPMGDGEMNHLEKCCENVAYNFSRDFPRSMAARYYTEKNHPSHAMSVYNGYQRDESDPYIKEISESYEGDKVGYWGPNIKRGTEAVIMCVEYGIDKWDFFIWYLTWVSMCEKEGLFDEIDFGMKVDVDDEKFVRHFIDMVCTRTGPMTKTVTGEERPLGDILAEGMARAIRLLGKEKYGDSPYHGRTNADGVPLELPVSLEYGWGHCSHWSGRGYSATHKAAWICNSLSLMVSSRDVQTTAHTREKYTDFLEYKDNPSTNPKMAKNLLVTDVYGELKDCLVSCEWTFHNPYWPDAEAMLFEAATGIKTTREELFEAGLRIKHLFRAIMMRNFGRTRDMEVEEIFPYLTYPDPWGETVTWDEWNDCADLYYKELGWDLQTAWPTRETWEKHDLKDIAVDMEKLGLLPPSGRDTYIRKESPFEGHYRRK